MNKKLLLKTFVGVMVFLLISGLAVAANSFVGNPISANIAKSKAKTYLNSEYKDLDLKIKAVNYNVKDGSYVIGVNSETSMDSHFSLRYRDGKIYGDTYETSVLSGMNTMERFCAEYKKDLTLLVKAKTDDVRHIAVLPEKLNDYGLKLDSPFQKSLVNNVNIAITSVGGTDAEHLSEVLKTVYALMKENGYAAKAFGITGEKESALTELRNIKPEHLENDNLAGILQKAITALEYDGITSFSKGL